MMQVEKENDHLIEFQLIEIVFYHLIEIMLITFDQLIRSSEIRSSDPLSLKSDCSLKS